jgi:hypothetical protein
MLLQPQDNTLLMEPMLAGQEKRHVAFRDVIYANGALSLVLAIEHCLVDWLSLELLQTLFRSWRCRIGRWIGLHQVRNDSIQRLLRVHSVACSGIFRIQESQDVL